MRMFMQIGMATAILATGVARGEESVYFSDPALQICIEDSLAVIDPTPSDMLQLTSLDCSHSGITSLSGIEEATNLSSLTASFNEITDLSPLQDLVKLRSLRINDNQITSTAELRDLENLTHVDVHNNNIQYPSGFSGMTRLQTLILRGNDITNVAAICCLPSLDSLHLEENELTEVSWLQWLPEVREIYLYDNHINDLKGLSRLETLNLLDLHNNEISSLDPLTSLTRLFTLNLEGNPNLNEQAYEQDLQTILDNNPGIALSYDPRAFPSVGVKASQGTHGNRIRVTWNAVNNGPLYPSFYKVYRASSPTGPKTAVSGWQQGTAFEDASVEAGRHYHYWISVAVNAFGEKAHMDEVSATGWTGQAVLTLTSTAGGVVVASPDLSGIRVGDIVDITAEPIDANLFTFATWSGTAVDEGTVLDPTNPSIRLEFNREQSLRAHFLTTLTTLYVSSDVSTNGETEPYQALGTALEPFLWIQDAIDVAGEGVTIVVEPGTYAENLLLRGKNIVLTGNDYPALQDREGTPLVSFVSGEGADCVLNGFLLTLGKSENASAIYCDNSHPTISNCLIVGNQVTDSEGRGSAVYAVNSQMTLANCTIADNLCGSLGAGVSLVDSDATVTNSVLWNNGPLDLRLEGTSTPLVRYTCTHSDLLSSDLLQAGSGNLSADPRFNESGQWTTLPGGASAWTSGDYHLQSQSGRWDEAAESWVVDGETSPCIDAGDPTWPVGAEPTPHGERVNMGAYGGTAQASKAF